MPTCKKCGKDFPNRMLIEGKIRNIGGRKYCLDCSPFGGRNTRNLTILKSIPKTKLCTKCNITKPAKDFYIRTDRECGLAGYCKKCANKQSALDVIKRGHNRKNILINNHGGKCIICDCNEPCALSFHHNIPENKTHGLSARFLSSLPINDCIRESNKCSLLCSNCHEEIHYPSLNTEILLTQPKRVSMPIHSGNTQERQHFQYIQRKLDFIQRKGGKCKLCGYNKNISALVFHHRNPSTKKFVLDSRSLGNRSLKACEQELKKCDLLCQNCHRSFHKKKNKIK